MSAPLVKRDLLKLRQQEAKEGPPAPPPPPSPEVLAAKVAQVKKLQALKPRVEASLGTVGTLLHPRTADLKKKGRVLVQAPEKPHVPTQGLPTLKHCAALGGKMRGHKKWKTQEARAKGLSLIGRKGGLAKARKRKALLAALDKLDRRIEKDRKALVKAGVPVEELD